jgi:signal transduction histidine kinase/ActR/RegA family two-component response regulator
MRDGWPSAVFRYLFAALVIAAAVLLRYLIDPWLGDQLALATLYGAVAIAVWIGGWGPALFAAALGYIACDWLFIQPRHAIGPLDAVHLISLAAYLLSCGIIAGLGEAMRVARRRASARAQELQTLFDIAPVPIWLGDAECKRIVGNRAAYEQHGFPPGINASFDAPVPELPQGLRVVAGGRDLKPEEMPMQLAARSGQTVRDFEHDVIRPDGSRVTMSANVSPMLGDAGQVRGVVGIYLDVTVRKAAEHALKESDRRKDEFLAALAHELRNPLAPIRNAVQILKLKGPPDPELAWSRDVIDRQVQHMVRLLEDLFDVSRIAHDKLELRKQEVELSEVIEMAVEMSRPLIDGRGHQLTLALPGEPVYLDADPARLAQVFANLLNNAAKYAEARSHIHLTGERRGSEAAVAVRDEGIGIAAEMLPRIFDMFIQAGRPLERSQGGLGIGLTLVRGLIELHGGSIEARSDGLGKGSEFLVRLPVLDLPAAGPQELPGESAEPLRGTRRLLIVDDLRDSADMLATFLEMNGHEVHTAYDGEEAITAAERFQPEVVLLDIGMPKVNGYEACRHIRRQPWGKEMFLIALTGWGQEDDRRRTEEAGFDHYMVKPADPATLLQLLASTRARLNPPQP